MIQQGKYRRYKKVEGRTQGGMSQESRLMPRFLPWWQESIVEPLFESGNPGGQNPTDVSLCPPSSGQAGAGEVVRK